MSRDTARVIEKRVRWACYLALAALALIIWSLVQPAPLPVIGAMSVGQLFGTLSLLFFLYALVADLRPALARVRAQAMKSASPQPVERDSDRDAGSTEERPER